MGAHHKNTDKDIGEPHAERRFRGNAYRILKTV